MKTLTELANHSGTDKGTRIGNKHGYTLVYDHIFSAVREKRIRLLEIGLSIGGPELGAEPGRQVCGVPSINMWLSYFPKARIWGLDISDCSKFQTDRFKFLQADCGDRDQIRNAIGERQFDLIIDDASHASFHQQLAFLELFPAVVSGGFYIIEDLDWQPQEYEENLPPVPKTAELMNWLVNPRKHPAHGLFADEIWRTIREEIASVQLFSKNDLDALIKVEEGRQSGPFQAILSIFKRQQKTKADPLKLAVIRKMAKGA